MRLRPAPAPGAARHARAFGDEPVPGRRRRAPGLVLVRPAADDAGRHAGDRTDAVSQPVPEHRAWHAGLDHVVRLGPGAGGYSVGTPARDWAGGAVHGPL